MHSCVAGGQELRVGGAWLHALRCMATQHHICSCCLPPRKLLPTVSSRPPCTTANAFQFGQVYARPAMHPWRILNTTNPAQPRLQYYECLPNDAIEDLRHERDFDCPKASRLEAVPGF